MLEPTERFTVELQRLAFEHHDFCTSCSHKFVDREHSYSGYLLNEEPAYVCEICSEKLVELAARTYFMSRPYEVPAPSAQLWRYMDFTKYVSLLCSRALYFTRADQFEDTYEGAKGLKCRRELWNKHYLDFFRTAIRNPPEGIKCTKSDEEIEANAQRLLKQLNDGGEASRLRTFISCWHENAHESAAMWRLYSSFLPNAVAIKTSYDSLYKALGRNTSIRIGRVQYLNLREEYAGVNEAYWRKRKSFEHEREVRAVIMDLRHCEAGKLIPCDLDTLVEGIYVSPEAPTWFVHLVNQVNQKFGLAVEVGESEFNAAPFF